MGRLWLRGASLIDAPLGASTPLTISEDGALATVESGDVKVYRNNDVAPRAFLVHHLDVVPDDTSALAALGAVDPLPGGTAVVTYPVSETHHSLPYRMLNHVADALNGGAEVAISPPPPLSQSTSTASDRVAYRSDRPEDVELDVTSDEGGYLVVGNEDYPGWSAEVDGRPTTLYRADFLLQAVQCRRATTWYHCGIARATCGLARR